MVVVGFSEEGPLWDPKEKEWVDPHEVHGGRWEEKGLAVVAPEGSSVKKEDDKFLLAEVSWRRRSSSSSSSSS